MGWGTCLVRAKSWGIAYDRVWRGATEGDVYILGNEVSTNNRNVAWATDPDYNPKGLIRKLRELRGCSTLKQLADIVDTHISDLSKMESGARPVGPFFIVKVLYEYPELQIMDVFELMGISEPYKYRI